jgi:hypothetical protein
MFYNTIIILIEVLYLKYKSIYLEYHKGNIYLPKIFFIFFLSIFLADI